MLGKSLVPLSLISCVLAAQADGTFETVIPDWTKWVFFFAGAIVIILLAWSICFGACMMLGTKMRVVIMLLAAGGIAIYGYFFFGPWWQDAIRA